MNECGKQANTVIVLTNARHNDGSLRMKPFLTQFATEKSASFEPTSWIYDSDLDQNVFVSNSSNPNIQFGTSTLTRVSQESTDSDFSRHNQQMLLGTKTITDVDVERTDTDYKDETPALVLGTKTVTGVNAEKTDNDYHNDYLWLH